MSVTGLIGRASSAVGVVGAPVDLDRVWLYLLEIVLIRVVVADRGVVRRIEEAVFRRHSPEQTSLRDLRGRSGDEIATGVGSSIGVVAAESRLESTMSSSIACCTSMPEPVSHIARARRALCSLKPSS